MGYLVPTVYPDPNPNSHPSFLDDATLPWQSEFNNSKCPSGNPWPDPGQDLSNLTSNPPCSNSPACTVTALNETVLEFHKEVLPLDPSLLQRPLGTFMEGVLVSTGSHGYSGCLRMARRAPELHDLDSQWHTHSQTSPRCFPAGNALCELCSYTRVTTEEKPWTRS